MLGCGLVPLGHCARPTHPLKSRWHIDRSFEATFADYAVPEGYRFDLSESSAAQAFYNLTQWSTCHPEGGPHIYPVSWTSLEQTGPEGTLLANSDSVLKCVPE